MKRNNLFCAALLFLSLIFLSLSQPSFVFEDGFSFFAWICYIPFFLLAERLSLKSSFLFGALYGSLSYFFMCPWLSQFGAVALSFVCFIFAIHNSLLFFLLVWSKRIFHDRLGKFYWIFRVFLLLSFEFLRTHGIFAFSYGIIAYSQWKNPAFLNFSSFFGVWGVSLIILLFNSIAAKVISERNLRSNLKKLSFSVSLIASVYVLYLFGNLFGKEDKSVSLSLALIQNASSAPSCKLSDYERDVMLLERLTDQALRDNPDTELVVWAETAVVPDILNNLENKTDQRRHALASFLHDYIKEKKVFFLIGNNHADSDGTHNSALFFDPATDSVGVYDKNHLVPFTEFWPSFLDFKIFDRIKSSLNCEFFAHGKSVRIFSIRGLKFATPICFEDSFSPLVRKMKKMGADFFVNISDDAWSKSNAARKMHLSMSAFRCAEFSTPMVRSTIDGKTCIINEKGRVLSELESGIDGYLCPTLSLSGSRKETFYLFCGDSAMIFISILIFSILLILSAGFVKVNTYGRR